MSHGPLHRHHFDPKTGEELRIEPVHLDDLPTLDGVIGEAVTLARTGELTSDSEP